MSNKLAASWIALLERRKGKRLKGLMLLLLLLLTLNDNFSLLSLPLTCMLRWRQMTRAFCRRQARSRRRRRGLAHSANRLSTGRVCDLLPAETATLENICRKFHFFPSLSIWLSVSPAVTWPGVCVCEHAAHCNFRRSQVSFAFHSYLFSLNHHPLTQPLERHQNATNQPKLEAKLFFILIQVNRLNWRKVCCTFNTHTHFHKHIELAWCWFIYCVRFVFIMMIGLLINKARVIEFKRESKWMMMSALNIHFASSL